MPLIICKQMDGILHIRSNAMRELTVEEFYRVSGGDDPHDIPL